MAAAGVVLCSAVPGEVIAQEAAGAAACRTFDRAERPATLFAPGDEILVTVDHLEPYALGRIDIVQSERTRLTTVLANEAGHLSTAWREATLPPEVVPGAASVEVVTADSRVTCGVQILDTNIAVPASQQRRTSYVTLWAFALLFFGSFLSLASFRRWRAVRLTALVHAPTFSIAEPVVPVTLPAPVERTAEPITEGPSDDGDEELVWDDAEEPEAPEPELDSEPEGLEDGDDGSEQADVDDDLDDDLAEVTSDTVARLMREARAWRDRRAL